jgi:PAS domain S-box-containing protein
MALVALDGRWMHVNAALCELLGYTEDELLATTFQELTHPDDLELDLRLLQETVDGRRAGYSMDKRYLHASGRIIHAGLLGRRRPGTRRDAAALHRPAARPDGAPRPRREPAHARRAPTRSPGS